MPNASAFRLGACYAVTQEFQSVADKEVVVASARVAKRYEHQAHLSCATAPKSMSKTSPAF